MKSLVVGVAWGSTVIVKSLLVESAWDSTVVAVKSLVVGVTWGDTVVRVRSREVADSKGPKESEPITSTVDRGGIFVALLNGVENKNAVGITARDENHDCCWVESTEDTATLLEEKYELEIVVDCNVDEEITVVNTRVLSEVRTEIVSNVNDG